MLCNSAVALAPATLQRCPFHCAASFLAVPMPPAAPMRALRSEVGFFPHSEVGVSFDPFLYSSRTFLRISLRANRASMVDVRPCRHQRV
jgi:hypothetical protein